MARQTTLQAGARATTISAGVPMTVPDNPRLPDDARRAARTPQALDLHIRLAVMEPGIIVTRKLRPLGAPAQSSAFPPVACPSSSVLL